MGHIGRTPTASCDPVVTEDYYRKGLEVGKKTVEDPQMMPALQARNHAATGVLPTPANTKP